MTLKDRYEDNKNMIEKTVWEDEKDFLSWEFLSICRMITCMGKEGKLKDLRYRSYIHEYLFLDWKLYQAMISGRNYKITCFCDGFH